MQRFILWEAWTCVIGVFFDFDIRNFGPMAKEKARESQKYSESPSGDHEYMPDFIKKNV